jgi:hypothetical protein
MRTKMAALLGPVALVAAACGEVTPTSVDSGLLPINPTSVEVLLTWEEFGSNLEVFGGYGSPRQLGTGVVAHAFGGVLEARTLVRFGPLPVAATVTDTTGTSRADTLLTRKGGRVVAFVDTLRSVADGPVTLELGAVSQRWDPGSLTWELAVDSGGVTIPWEQAGAGPIQRVATAVWDPAQGDSVVFVLDSAQVGIFQDTSAVNQGAVVGMVSEGARLKVDNVVLRATVIPSVRPDTLVDISALRVDYSFVYTPQPEAPSGSVRVGGAPAWRTVMDIDVPLQLTGPASLCAEVGCPVTLTPTRVNYAALVVTTRPTEAAFQPTDSVNVDIRTVYQRSAMPKSPLGPSLFGSLGRRVSGESFGEGRPTEVEIPITGFVRDIVSGELIGGFPPPRSLVLMASFEPSSITYASFFGPGSPAAPMLKLIVTAGRPVQMP